jgi:hypothetical protein
MARARGRRAARPPGAGDDVDHRRELAIEVHDDEVIARLTSVVHRDWEGSRPLDLSDAGLLADLADCEDELQRKLGITPARE